MDSRRRFGGALLSLLALAAGANACKGNAGGEALAKAESKEDLFAHVPPPPADGPKLVALRAASVMDRPTTTAAKIGGLALGSIVARSREPVTQTGCKGGWYAVRPRGFVCADAAVATDERAAHLAPAPANLERALPYRYARAKVDNVPMFARVPSAAEQLAQEPDLGKRGPKPLEVDPIGAGANDVPLDARLGASGPPVLLATGEGTDGGRRTAASFFGFGHDAVAPLLPLLDSNNVKAGALKKGNALALAGSFAWNAPGGTRRFGVTPDGLLVPLDRMKPALGSTFHGMDLEGTGLPIAFVHKQGVHTFNLRKGKASKNEDELERRAILPLTGKFRTVEGVRYEESREGEWLRAQDLVTVVKRSKLPDFARGTQKWIDVSIANQTLTAYEGNKPIYVTLVSTGRDQLKDPASSASTPRGAFRVKSKSVRRTLDPREAGGGVDVADAPWSLELDTDAALVGAYWTDGFGEASTFHDVALAPIDAHRLWTWATPELPDGWMNVATRADEAGNGKETLVSIRP